VKQTGIIWPTAVALIMFVWLGAAALALTIVSNSPRYAAHEEPDVVLSRENEYLRLSGKWTRCDPELDENG
jgi:hypothetical protein